MDNNNAPLTTPKIKQPLWVFLAFSSITQRKHAQWLIASCIAFTFYCIPWAILIPNQPWLAKLFLITDWSWVAMMVPLVIWYRLSLRWMDRHDQWDQA